MVLDGWHLARGCNVRMVLDGGLIASVETATAPGSLVAYMLSIYVYFNHKQTDCICTVVLTITANDGGTTGVFVDICEVEQMPIEVVAAVAREIDPFKRKLNRRRILTNDEIEESVNVVNLLREGIRESPDHLS